MCPRHFSPPLAELPLSSPLSSPLLSPFPSLIHTLLILRLGERGRVTLLAVHHLTFLSNL